MFATMMTMVCYAIGGLGLFLYGMGQMSDGLKKAAGQKMKQLMESMTGTPLLGFATGTVVTALVQSSSATTVMIIGLVNAGLMTLKQAVPVIFGTNVGTTATAWIVSLTGFKFNIILYAMPVIGAGFLLNVAGRSRRARNLGQVLLGFGILFVGLYFMKLAFTDLRGDQAAEDVWGWLAFLKGRVLLAVIVSTLMTMILQSSSASIAIIQVLALNGAFGDNWAEVLAMSIPFVLGGNIGTTITAQIASLQANLGSRRTAWAHTMFNVVGVALVLPLVYTGLFVTIVLWIAPWEVNAGTIMLTIAIAHTLFNVVNSLLFLPFAGILEKIVVSLIKPRRGEVVERAVVLEKHLLSTPALALQQAKREIIRMAGEAMKAVKCACQGLSQGDIKQIDRTRRVEDVVDEYQTEITTYLVELSQRQLSDEVSIELPVLLHMVNDLERVSDHAVNIAEIAERKIEQKLTFGEEAATDSAAMVKETYDMFDNIVAALESSSIQAAHSALAGENKLNRMQIRFRRGHVQRMTDGTCSARSGLIFIDLVDNLEKIGDHLTNIAQSVIGGIQWEGVESGSLSGEYDAINDQSSQ
ncbi:MAG: sodium-dependent phosphate transporter [Planctomycetota bacterium]|nr:MAG: sodium-dependent phosphate transporter [Planctomycetota bacterium]